MLSGCKHPRQRFVFLKQNRDMLRPIWTVRETSRLPRSASVSSWQETFKGAADVAVALARDLFETSTVDDLDYTPALADQTRRLERARNETYRGALNPYISARNSWVRGSVS
jgi:hypothetical protein